ncbi:WD domain, G-beta repeat [seawater metagenome]|uniref:WD domain, G-beta repeat n=1 Tax=seawater metagenome TaxID=1561972 RepID=A0A5E8CHK2_9ZZZZ
MPKGKVSIKDFYNINDLLPPQVLLEVFKLCRPEQIRPICKHWYKATQNDILWKCWYQDKFTNKKLKESWQESYFYMLFLENNWINNRFFNKNFYDNSWITNCKLFNNTIITTSQWGFIKEWDLNTILNQNTNNSLPFVYSGNIGPIHCLDCNESLIVTGSDDGVIKIWKRNKMNYTKMLTYHHQDVFCIKIIEDKIISGSKDNIIYVYDLKTLNKTILKGHTHSVWSIEKKNDTLFSSSLDGTVRIWNLNNKNEYDCTTCLEISKYAVLKIVLFKNFLIVATWNGKIEIWNIHEKELTYSITAHSDYISGLKCFNDILVSSSYDNQVKIWKITTKGFIGLKLVNVLDLEKITCLDINEKELVCCSSLGKIHYFNFDVKKSIIV